MACVQEAGQPRSTWSAGGGVARRDPRLRASEATIRRTPLSRSGESGDEQRARRHERRRFATRLAPVAIILLALGVLFAGDEGVWGVVGLVALAQGIGLAVALVWLAAGHNPLSNR